MTDQESAGQLRRFKCQRLPQYIILHFKRFTKNAFVEEKNPTIINFPLRGLDFRECVYLPFLLFELSALMSPNLRLSFENQTSMHHFLIPRHSMT